MRAGPECDMVKCQILPTARSRPVKKGRHRRYEEARDLKHQSDQLDDLFHENEEPCVECGALPGQDHRSWCLNVAATASPDDDDDGNFPA